MVSPRGYLFIGLNVVRALSIIALLLVFSSSIFVMVTDVRAVNEFTATKESGNNSTDNAILDSDYIQGSTVPNQPAGVFWAIVNRLLIIFQIIALILAEVGWPAVFFERYFPVLGRSFGLGALGIFQGLIGAAILSHHVDDFSLVSAFFLFAIGCLNMLLGLIFRESAKDKRSITSWRSDSKKILPLSYDPKSASSPSFLSSTYKEEKGRQSDDFVGGFKGDKAGYGFGRQGEKQAGLKGFILQKPEESLPRYAPKIPGDRVVSVRSSTSSHSSHHSRHSSVSSDASDSSHHDEHAPVPTFKSSGTAL